MFSPDADLFFCCPRTAPTFPGWFGNLYLLRRDIDQCMGLDPNSGNGGRVTCLWPGAMAIMAGFDLMAKFYAGSDETGKVRERFLNFVKHYCTVLSEPDRETVYQLRNSLLHSFGLYSKTKKGKIEKIYRFTVTHGGHPLFLMSHTPPDEYCVHLEFLHRFFEKSVLDFQAELESNAPLQARFTALFSEYGKTHIG